MSRIATLHFIDGSKLSFAFPEQTANTAARTLKIADFLAGKNLVIEAEGQVFIFPVTSIKYVMLSTPSAKDIKGVLPRSAIIGARIRD